MSTVRVYFNGRGIDVPAACTALEALRGHDVAAAEEVARGGRALVDSRGLAADASSLVYAGAIYRVVSARAAASDPA